MIAAHEQVELRLQGTENQRSLVPGDYVCHCSDPNSCGIVVAVNVLRVSVLWSQLPNDNAYSMHRFKQTLDLFNKNMISTKTVMERLGFTMEELLNDILKEKKK